MTETVSKSADKPDTALSHGGDWNFELLQEYDHEIAKIAKEFGLDTYPNQIEVISSAQMLDASASRGFPISHTHWRKSARRQDGKEGCGCVV